jgi:dihydrolipoamide dehydrogenase
VASGRTDGLTKLTFEAETGRLLGVGIVGAHAGDLIAEAVLAIELGALAEDLAGTIHTHPTLSETLGEAADLFLGRPLHLPPG